MEKVAAERDCVMMAVGNVVLVGRPVWVDRTATSLGSIANASGRQDTATVSWDALSTPQEAIAAATGSTSRVVSPPLPHDLWPAVHWRQIDRRIAIALVLAQFDLCAQPSASSRPIRCLAATSEGKFLRRYLAEQADASVRGAIQRCDPHAAIRATGDWLEVTTTAAAHRAATTMILAEQAKAVSLDQPEDTRTFSLNPTRATAGELLRSFAETAGRKCVIDPAAAEACGKMVTIEAENQTLRQLIERVANLAGVAASWQQDDIVITPAK
jgi:hypothetical protein